MDIVVRRNEVVVKTRLYRASKSIGENQSTVKTTGKPNLEQNWEKKLSL